MDGEDGMSAHSNRALASCAYAECVGIKWFGAGPELDLWKTRSVDILII